jgi:YesN/AraC family two-component response regulator
MASSGIIVVDDDEMVREVLSRQLGEQGFDVSVASDGREAWDMIREKGCEVLITDLEMPRMTGQELIEKIKDHSPATIVIVLTGHGSLDSAREAIHAGCDEYLLKPLQDTKEITLVVKRCLDRHRLLMQAIVCKRINMAKSMLIHETTDELVEPAHNLLNAIDGLVLSLKKKDTERMLALAEVVKKNIEEITYAVGKLAESSGRLKAVENGEPRKDI